MSYLSVKKSEKDLSSKEAKMNETKAKGDLLGLVSIVLIVGSIGTFCFMGYKYYIFKEKGMLLSGVEESVALERKDFDIDVFENREPISYYEGVISKRNIFQAPWDKEKKEVVKKAEEVVSLARMIKLIGVLLDDNPTAIIENIKERKTLFMSIGDQINGAVLDEIHEGKIIFLQNSVRIEITQ